MRSGPGSTSQIGINSRIPRLVVHLSPSGSTPVEDQLTSQTEDNTAAPKSHTSLGGPKGKGGKGRAQGTRKKKTPVPDKDKDAAYYRYRDINNGHARKSYSTMSQNKKAEKTASLLKENATLKDRLKVACRKIEDLEKTSLKAFSH